MALRYPRMSAQRDSETILWYVCFLTAFAGSTVAAPVVKIRPYHALAVLSDMLPSGDTGCFPNASEWALVEELNQQSWEVALDPNAIQSTQFGSIQSRHEGLSSVNNLLVTDYTQRHSTDPSQDWFPSTASVYISSATSDGQFLSVSLLSTSNYTGRVNIGTFCTYSDSDRTNFNCPACTDCCTTNSSTNSSANNNTCTELPPIDLDTPMDVRSKTLVGAAFPQSASFLSNIPTAITAELHFMPVAPQIPKEIGECSYVDDNFTSILTQGLDPLSDTPCYLLPMNCSMVINVYELQSNESALVSTMTLWSTTYDEPVYRCNDGSVLCLFDPTSNDNSYPNRQLGPNTIDFDLFDGFNVGRNIGVACFSDSCMIVTAYMIPYFNKTSSYNEAATTISISRVNIQNDYLFKDKQTVQLPCPVKIMDQNHSLPQVAKIDTAFLYNTSNNSWMAVVRRGRYIMNGNQRISENAYLYRLEGDNVTWTYTQTVGCDKDGSVRQASFFHFQDTFWLAMVQDNGVWCMHTTSKFTGLWELYQTFEFTVDTNIVFDAYPSLFIEVDSNLRFWLLVDGTNGTHITEYQLSITNDSYIWFSSSTWSNLDPQSIAYHAGISPLTPNLAQLQDEISLLWIGRSIYRSAIGNSGV